jgi:DNA-binding NarL/FixJ family response regulator
MLGGAIMSCLVREQGGHDIFGSDRESRQRSRKLNARECHVLSLAAEGLSGKAVGEHLGWPLERVWDCLIGAYTALGARSKLEAIVLAYRRGEL